MKYNRTCWDGGLNYRPAVGESAAGGLFCVRKADGMDPPNHGPWALDHIKTGLRMGGSGYPTREDAASAAQALADAVPALRTLSLEDLPDPFYPGAGAEILSREEVQAGREAIAPYACKGVRRA